MSAECLSARPPKSAFPAAGLTRPALLHPDYRLDSRGTHILAMSMIEFQKRFSDETACREFLEQVR